MNDNLNRLEFDNRLVRTRLKPRNYYPKEVCRIVNPKQCLMYIKHGLFPIDMYASIDDKTGNDITVMIFDRQESYPLYQAWCNHELV